MSKLRKIFGIGVGVGICGNGILSYDYYRVGVDGDYLFDMSEYRRFDYLINQSIDK